MKKIKPRKLTLRSITIVNLGIPRGGDQRFVTETAQTPGVACVTELCQTVLLCSPTWP